MLPANDMQVRIRMGDIRPVNQNQNSFVCWSSSFQNPLDATMLGGWQHIRYIYHRIHGAVDGEVKDAIATIHEDRPCAPAHCTGLHT